MQVPVMPEKLDARTAVKAIMAKIGAVETGYVLGVTKQTVYKWANGDVKILPKYNDAIATVYFRLVFSHARDMITSFMVEAEVETATLIKSLLDVARRCEGCPRCLHSRAVPGGGYVERACNFTPARTWPECAKRNGPGFFDGPRFINPWLLGLK